jgi:hypothetical protein
MEVCGGGEHGGAIQDRSSTTLPSFISCSGGEILRDAIVHYNGNEFSATMMRLFVALRAPPHRLIKVPGMGITVVPSQILHGVLD